MEQVNLLTAKFNAWKDLAEQMNRDMEGKSRLSLPAFPPIYRHTFKPTTDFVPDSFLFAVAFPES
jgi:hypothetical protein